MAGIGKPKPQGDEGGKKGKDASLQELKEQFVAVADEIRGVIGGRQDKNQISREDKAQLRTLYTRAANIARSLAGRCTGDEAEDWAKKQKQLMDKAVSYGSIQKNEIPKTTMDDVKGMKEVKDMVETFLFMLENPQILKDYHMEGGLGLLLYGAPGTGKTMIAAAIANRMQMPMFVMTPADIFKSYVGESEQAVKQIFQEIEACEDGAILFVDECESIFSKRGQDDKDYKAAVTTELLQRINGFGVDGSKRILIGATNRPDKIDPAFLRYKRFSHQIHITPPDAEAKEAIIEGKLKGIPMESGLSVRDILMMSEMQTTKTGEVGYYSAADICGILEEACRIAIEQLIKTNTKQTIPLTREMFERAFAKKPPSISASVLASYSNFAKDLDDAMG